jgi:urease accessory protein
MRFNTNLFAIATLAGLAFAPAVSAHTFGAHGAGFAEGLSHPLLGVDHLLAMIAVGVWAAQLGGAALWRVPLAFLAAMAGGAWLANPFMDAAVLELGIGVSVLALGLLIAFRLRLSGLLSLLAVALFAGFHGFAHGLEMPQAASPVGYGLGFLTATAGLHLLGLMLGLLANRGNLVLQAGGVAIAAAGVWILAV